MIAEEELKRVNQGKDSWFRNDGETLHIHCFDGLNGHRCGLYIRPFIKTRCAITWDEVTCPMCLMMKKEDEPWSVEIDTKGD